MRGTLFTGREGRKAQDRRCHAAVFTGGEQRADVDGAAGKRCTHNRS